MYLYSRQESMLSACLLELSLSRLLCPCCRVLRALHALCRPINFSLACLSSVFVLVLHILLVQNFHVGTQLLSTASLLGTVWSGIAAAGIVVSGSGGTLVTKYDCLIIVCSWLFQWLL